MKENFTPKLLTTILSLFLITSSQAGIMDIFKKESPLPKTPSVTPELQGLPYQKWQDTESGRFAHGLQYEQGLVKPVPYQFTPGKNRDQEGLDYFDHLCTTEGKDYIFRTATGVDTIAQLRSFEIPESSIANSLGVQSYLYHPYALEAPMFFDELSAGKFFDIKGKQLETYTFGPGSSTSGIFRGARGFYASPYINYQIRLNDGKLYNFKYDFIKQESDKKEGKNLSTNSYKNIEKLDKITARYGFTWRGFSRPQDREYGIAGGDLIVVDLEKNEIMAIERTFIKARLSYSPSTRVNWNGVGCFEQYKNESIHKNKNFIGKTFEEKVKLIYDSEPSQSYLPQFLSKIIMGK